MLKSKLNFNMVFAIAITLFSVFFASAESNPQALNENSTWSEIAQSNLMIHAPQIGFGTTKISVLDTCHSELNMYSQYPVEVCVKFKSIKGERVCSITEKQYLFRSLQTISRVCQRYATQHECVSWKDQPQFQQLNFNIPVYQGSSEHQSQLIFTKEFDVPFCGN